MSTTADALRTLHPSLSIIALRGSLMRHDHDDDRLRERSDRGPAAVW